MLKTLFIKNYALIDELTVRFSGSPLNDVNRKTNGRGLVIITGETGAGKSIIIDALGLIIGERASTEVVRTGAEKAVVEGVFEISGNKKLRAFLKENDIEFTDEFIVRREVSIKGTTRCLVNDSAITLGMLKKIGELLVDLHGQHEHQSLLRTETHIDMLDEFGGLDKQVDEFRAVYKRMRDTSAQLRELKEREAQLKEKLELYTFQIKEIDAVAPQAGEEEKIEQELKILENAEKLVSTATGLYELLYEGENSVHDLLSKAGKQLVDLTQIDKQFADAVDECKSAEAIVNELAKFLQRYSSNVEFNAERLEELRQRMVSLIALKKKYGGTLEATLAHRERIGKEAELGENFDANIRKLTTQLDGQRKVCGQLAEQLSAKRRDAAKKLDKSILAELANLGIQNAKFVAQIRQHVLPSHSESDGEFVQIGKQLVRVFPDGADEVEFLISTNLGEEVKPLAKVASGGEVSRIMLALKSILAKSDKLPVLIFDEIDTGVSGRIAQAVGLSLKNLSTFHQIIAITHLPQIAGLADVHFVVEKSEDAKRATTSMRMLSTEERVQEVAKLMSGAEVTEAGLRSARELMGVK
ncbi:MAG: DNA repair protein RecN [Bacteroidetes bacterium]|nr:DNA repair protein RecN [Bacteroidota bacterium]MCW5894734.1 DNA repair protein RecN [Bacteroidota bacterium]